jgi:hypothetical protein
MQTARRRRRAGGPYCFSQGLSIVVAVRVFVFRTSHARSYYLNEKSSRKGQRHKLLSKLHTQARLGHTAQKKLIQRIKEGIVYFWLHVYSSIDFICIIRFYL